MAVSLLDNFNYNGKKPNFSRDLMPSIEVMKNYSENYLPPVFECLCEEDGNKYRYNVSNSVDPILSKWRLISGRDSADLSDYYKKSETDELLNDKVNKEDGKGLSQENFTTVYKVKIGDSILKTSAKNISDAINEIKTSIDDTTLKDKLDEIDELLTKLDNDKETEGSIRYLDNQVYVDSKTYTDERIESMNKKKSIACDEKPIYTKGAEKDTITYKINGVSHTIDADEIWFYYMEENDLNGDLIISANEVGLAQTIFIDGVEFTIMSFGIDMTEYVNKTIDVVSTYSGEESDKSKIPNLASMKSLETKVMTEVDEKININDIEDSLTSTSTNKVLSANQGKLIKDELDGKLNIEQGSENANKKLITDESGNITLVDFGGDSSSDKVEYNNAEHTDWNNVKKALDGIIAKVFYVEPKINSFSMSPSTTEYEVGQSVTSLNFTWSLNKPMNSVTLTDCTVSKDDTSASWSGNLTTNKTFTLTCNDGEKTTSSSKTISFKHKIYYGSASIPTTYNSAFILGLSNKNFATTYKGKFNITVGNNEYGFICCPTSWNIPNVCKIGGFGTDLVNVGNFSFTNASGGVTTYKIVRTSVASLGAIEMLFE